MKKYLIRFLIILFINNTTWLLASVCCSCLGQDNSRVKIVDKSVQVLQSPKDAGDAQGFEKRFVQAVQLTCAGKVMGYDHGQIAMHCYESDIIEAIVIDEESISRGVNQFEDKPIIKNNAAVNKIGAGLARAALNGRSPFA